MKYYSVPADFKKETIDGYARLNQEYSDSQVIETYGNITINNFMESGRAVSQLPQIDLLDLQDYVEYSKEQGIDFNYTLNALYIGNREFTEAGVLWIMDFLREIYLIGVRSLTVALPSLVELIQKSGYDFKIKTSTLCQVTDANKASAYKRMGVERIVADEAINRDFGSLGRIVKAFGDKVEIIVNPLCHKNCIYRMFHYNQIGGDSVKNANQVSVNYYEHRCVLQRYNHLSDILRMCWVRPEDLHYYTSIGISYFKLQGRQVILKGDPLRTVEAYFAEKHEGDLMDILNMFTMMNNFKVYVDNSKLAGFIKPFYEHENFCKNDCRNCKYCEQYAQKCIDVEQATEVMGLAKNFYHEYDQYMQLLNSVQNTLDKTEAEEMDLQMDFEIDF